MQFLAATTALAAGVLLLAACGARSALPDGVVPAPTTTGSTGGSGGGGAAPGSSTTSAGTGGSGGCGGLPGPSMATVPLPDGGSFCIDSTEVTNAQYRAFTAAGVPLSQQSQCCSGNTSYGPAFTPPPGSDDLPVVFVDWCSAFDYCAWAGKRLCGKIGGGSLNQGNFQDPMQSQWLYACTQGGLKTFPYGNVQENTACVTLDLSASVHTLEPVGSAPGCVGGFPGIFDMTGNASEWDDTVVAGDCSQDGDALSRGGSYALLTIDSACSWATSVPRRVQVNSFGFRCCKD